MVWKIEVRHINVSIGDSTLIIIEGEIDGKTIRRNILIDGGKTKKDSEKIAKALPSATLKLDGIILTHDDDDHIGGLAEFIENKTVHYNRTYFYEQGVIRANKDGNVGAFTKIETALNESKNKLIPIRASNRQKSKCDNLAVDHRGKDNFLNAYLIGQDLLWNFADFCVFSFEDNEKVKELLSKPDEVGLNKIYKNYGLLEIGGLPLSNQDYYCKNIRDKIQSNSDTRLKKIFDLLIAAIDNNAYLKKEIHRSHFEKIILSINLKKLEDVISKSVVLTGFNEIIAGLQNSTDMKKYVKNIKDKQRETLYNEKKSIESMNSMNYSSRPLLVCIACNEKSPSPRTAAIIEDPVTAQNRRSIATLLLSENNKILYYLAGDLTDVHEKKIANWLSQQKIDNDVKRVMKLSHHGAIGSTPISLVRTLKPKYAIASVGTHHYHPSLLLLYYFQYYKEKNDKDFKFLSTKYPYYLKGKYVNDPNKKDILIRKIDKYKTEIESEIEINDDIKKYLTEKKLNTTNFNVVLTTAVECYKVISNNLPSSNDEDTLEYIGVTFAHDKISIQHKQPDKSVEFQAKKRKKTVNSLPITLTSADTDVNKTITLGIAESGNKNENTIYYTVSKSSEFYNHFASLHYELELKKSGDHYDLVGESIKYFDALNLTTLVCSFKGEGDASNYNLTEFKIESAKFKLEDSDEKANPKPITGKLSHENNKYSYDFQIAELSIPDNMLNGFGFIISEDKIDTTLSIANDLKQATIKFPLKDFTIDSIPSIAKIDIVKPNLKFEYNYTYDDTDADINIYINRELDFQEIKINEKPIQPTPKIWFGLDSSFFIKGECETDFLVDIDFLNAFHILNKIQFSLCYYDKVFSADLYFKANFGSRNGSALDVNVQMPSKRIEATVNLEDKTLGDLLESNSNYIDYLGLNKISFSRFTVSSDGSDYYANISSDKTVNYGFLEINNINISMQIEIDNNMSEKIKNKSSEISISAFFPIKTIYTELENSSKYEIESDSKDDDANDSNASEIYAYIDAEYSDSSSAGKNNTINGCIPYINLQDLVDKCYGENGSNNNFLDYFKNITLHDLKFTYTHTDNPTYSHMQIDAGLSILHADFNVTLDFKKENDNKKSIEFDGEWRSIGPDYNLSFSLFKDLGIDGIPDDLFDIQINSSKISFISDSNNNEFKFEINDNQMTFIITQSEKILQFNIPKQIKNLPIVNEIESPIENIELHWGANGKFIHVGLINNTKCVIPISSKTPSLRFHESNHVSSDNNSDSTAWVKFNKSLGPIILKRIGIKYESGKIWLVLDSYIKLGPISIELMGLAVGMSIKNITDLEFQMNGLGLDYSAPPLSIGGSFHKDLSLEVGNVSTAYTGSALLRFEELAIAAIGAYMKFTNEYYNTTKQDCSVFVYTRINYPFGGPSFCFITGFSGGFGYNQLLRLPNIDEVTDFPLIQGAVSAVPDNNSLIDQLTQTEDQLLHSWITPTANQYWFALGLDFTTFQIIGTRALLIGEFGHSLQFALLGKSSLVLPLAGASEPIVDVELGLQAAIKPDEGIVSASAMISNNSFVLDKNCHLMGGFALSAWFKDHATGAKSGDFVVTIGGYHPAFSVPKWYPKVPRLGFRWNVSDKVTITGESYFAITPSHGMVGGLLQVTFAAGNLNAWFNAVADFLVEWHPLHFDAHVGVSVGASYHVNLLFFSTTFRAEIGAELALWGPPIGGRAEIDWYIISFSVPFGADKRNKPQISWDEFKKLLPTKNNELALNQIIIEDGLIENNNNEWIVRPSGFRFHTESVIPITKFVSSFANDLVYTENTKGYMVNPLRITMTSNVHTITILKRNTDGTISNSDIQLHAKVIKRNIPKALWSETNDNSSSTIESYIGLTVWSHKETNAPNPETISIDDLNRPKTIPYKPNSGYFSYKESVKSQYVSADISTILSKINGENTVKTRKLITDKLIKFGFFKSEKLSGDAILCTDNLPKLLRQNPLIK